MPSSPFRPAAARTALRAVAVLSTATVAACGDDRDPFAPIASQETALVGFTLFPLSADPLLPAAVDLAGRRSVRPALLGGTVLNFDVAFDLDAQGRVVLYPPSRIAVPPTGAPRTGLQMSTEGFDAVTIAPRGGYRYDSTAVVTPGQVVVVQASGASCSPSYPMHAKLVIDSVGSATAQGRRIYLRARINPNCGFRSLEAGLPKS